MRHTVSWISSLWLNITGRRWKASFGHPKNPILDEWPEIFSRKNLAGRPLLVQTAHGTQNTQFKDSEPWIASPRLY